jgi:hypothetical protein
MCWVPYKELTSITGQPVSYELKLCDKMLTGQSDFNFRLSQEISLLLQRPNLLWAPHNTLPNKLRGLSPLATYIDRVTAACRRS